MLRKIILTTLLIITHNQIYAESNPLTLLSLNENASIKKIEEIEKKEYLSLSKDELLKLGVLYHNLARSGDKTAGKKAVKVLEEYLNHKWEAKVLALLGSAKSMVARDASIVSDKVKFVNQGIADLNEAVSIAPFDPTVRNIRINVFSNLPSMFSKNETVIADIDFLLEHKMYRDEEQKSNLLLIKEKVKNDR